MSITVITTPTPISSPTQNSVVENILSFLFDWMIPIILLVVLVSVSIIVFKWAIKKKKSGKGKDLLFKDFNIGEYSVIMFRKINERYVEIERLKMSITDKSFHYKNKDFPTFDIKKPFFSDKKYNYYGFDYDNGDQLTVNTKGMPDKITIDEIDIYVNRGIIEQIVRGLEEPKNKKEWIMLIVGAVLGVGIGIIIGQAI